MLKHLISEGTDQQQF